MELLGYWTTGITAGAAAVAGSAWALARRRLAYFMSAVALFLWLNAISFFIENCGVGGDCHRYANWEAPKAALVAGVPALMAGAFALGATMLVRRRSRTVQKALLLPESYLPEHESFRRMVADPRGTGYKSYGSLEEAQADDDAVAVLQGDDGGQIYAVIPVRDVRCSIAALERLLSDLDEISWPGNDPDMKRIYFEHQPPGSGIPGGMGGALATGEVWVHEEFRKMGLADDIRGVIQGKIDQIRTKGRDKDLP